MNNKVLPVFILLIAAFFVNGCIDQTETQIDSERTVIIVSILPQADFVEHVGGDNVDVIVMIPPGANPATYEPMV